MQHAREQFKALGRVLYIGSAADFFISFISASTFPCNNLQRPRSPRNRRSCPRRNPRGQHSRKHYTCLF